MARIVIAGCGDVGSRLGLLLVGGGHEVWGLRRNPSALPDGIQPLAADLDDADSLRCLPPGLDTVFYTAAAGGYTEQRYRTAYVTGITNVINMLKAQAQRPRRLVFASSTSVYAQTNGELIDEDSPATAGGFSGECLRLGEQGAWDGPFPATVVRFGGIYGPGRTRLLNNVRNGTATCTPGVFSNRIHSDDCARMLAHIFALESAPKSLYLGVDDTPVEHCEVVRWLAAELAVPPPITENTAANDSPRRRSNKRCSNARLRASGFRCLYPSFREGYRAMLADLSP